MPGDLDTGQQSAVPIPPNSPVQLASHVSGLEPRGSRLGVDGGRSNSFREPYGDPSSLVTEQVKQDVPDFKPGTQQVELPSKVPISRPPRQRSYSTPAPDCQGVPEHNSESAVAATPSAPAQNNGRLGVLFANLVRIAQLRMAALESRSLAREHSKNMRISQRKLVQNTRELLRRIREAFVTLKSQDPSALKKEDITSWEDRLFVIEGLLERGEHAAGKFDLEQNNDIGLEWDMCGLEEELYGELAPTKASWQRNRFRATDNPQTQPMARLGPEHAVLDSSASEHQGFDPGLSENAESEHLSQVLAGILYPDHDAEDVVNIDASFDGLDGIDGIEDDDDFIAFATLSRSSRDEDLAQSAPPEQAEDHLQSGSQFLEVNLTDSMNAARNNHFGDRSYQELGVSKDDLLGFIRWLVYGTPWNAQPGSRNERLQSALSNISLLRASILQGFEAVYQGHLVAPHAQAAEDERTFSALLDYVKLWFWDPFIGTSSGAESSHRDPNERATICVPEPSTEPHLIAVQFPSKPFSEPVGVENLSMPAQTLPPHHTALPGRRRSSVAIDARSEQSPAIRHDSLAQKSPRNRRSSLS